MNQRLAKAEHDYAVKIRRKLHQITELSWQEEKTLELIKSEIREITQNFPYPTYLTQKDGGIWLDINVSPEYDRILLRSDVDALPIQEETDLPFSSLNPNCMHACGHDCHSAMLLGALRALSHGELIPVYNLRFIWQRAEEVLHDLSGGDRLVEEGACHGIAASYGLHISSIEENGVFLSKPGYMMSNAGQLFIDFSCLGGHVMFPQQGANAIDIMTDIHVALRGFALRSLGPNESISFVPSISTAGSAPNVCPGKGSLCYSVRNFLSPKRLEEFLSSIKQRVESIIYSYNHGKLTSFKFCSGHPPLINDPQNYQFVSHTLQKLGFNTAISNVLFSGEDFAYYLQSTRGSFWILGAKQDPGYGHHSTKFNPDESVFWQGIAFWLSAMTTHIGSSGFKSAMIAQMDQNLATSSYLE